MDLSQLIFLQVYSNYIKKRLFDKTHFITELTITLIACCLCLQELLFPNLKGRGAYSYTKEIHPSFRGHFSVG